MYREIKDSLPGYLGYRAFYGRGARFGADGEAVSAAAKRGWLAALGQLNPSGDSFLAEALAAWQDAAQVREVLVSDDGGVRRVRYDLGNVQLIADFETAGKEERLVAYTVINGAGGRLADPEIVTTTIPGAEGVFGDEVWRVLEKSVSKLQGEDFFVVADSEKEDVYFQAWVEPEKDGIERIDVEYCLGWVPFHFKTQIRSRAELARLIAAVRDEGLAALDWMATRLVQIVPDPDSDTW